MKTGLSLLNLFSSLLLVNCMGHAPKIEICQTESKLGTATCVLKNGDIRILRSSQLDKYSCIPNDDFQEYVNYCYEK